MPSWDHYISGALIVYNIPRPRHRPRHPRIYYNYFCNMIFSKNYKKYKKYKFNNQNM